MTIRTLHPPESGTRLACERTGWTHQRATLDGLRVLRCAFDVSLPLRVCYWVFAAAEDDGLREDDGFARLAREVDDLYIEFGRAARTAEAMPAELAEALNEPAAVSETAADRVQDEVAFNVRADRELAEALRVYQHLRSKGYAVRFEDSPLLNT